MEIDDTIPLLIMAHIQFLLPNPGIYIIYIYRESERERERERDTHTHTERVY